MKKDGIIHMKIEFEHIPMIDRQFKGMEEAERAFELIRRKLK
jgi:hypothetical protein